MLLLWIKKKLHECNTFCTAPSDGQERMGVPKIKYFLAVNNA